MDQKNVFHTHDAFLGVWTERNHDTMTYFLVRRLLRRAGFTFHLDPEVRKRYKCISKDYHAGSCGDVHFVSQIYPAGFRFQFYENVIRDNPCGGLYHFDKMAKAPYLWRLRVTLIRRKIGKLLARLGFTDATDRPPADALGWVRHERAKQDAFQRTTVHEPPAYGSDDAEKRPLRDGEIRYFRDWNGRLLRGPVYHHINNMWWVLVSPTEVRNMACFDLFTFDPAKHKRKENVNAIRRMKDTLKKVVDREDFERAICLRDEIKRREQSEAVHERQGS